MGCARWAKPSRYQRWTTTGANTTTRSSQYLYMNNDLIGIIGALVFVAVTFMCLRTSFRWSAETKKREEEEQKLTTIVTPYERSQNIILVRDPSEEPIPYVASQQ